MARNEVGTARQSTRTSQSVSDTFQGRGENLSEKRHSLQEVCGNCLAVLNAIQTVYGFSDIFTANDFCDTNRMCLPCLRPKPTTSNLWSNKCLGDYVEK
ncbi:hypothetical protein AVEN_222257-1 [Araneus ventricosus]|uniref:Uncharacterized protein n=1 Tax=Araneus ventricosus TaxID=182803 RepID=A0A4Y2PZ90_ARAVE|nr:hypothetical protein AVEN_222257-1 [Araneus ventricosus]